MSEIGGISGGYTIDPSLNKLESDKTSMGKDDFLLLLVAQLENQDPMDPEDATEFTSQLAEFSSLEQLQNANQSLEGLGAMSSEMERMSALGLIGQNVVAQTDQFHFSGEPVDLGYRLDLPAEDVKLYVLNQTGATVATITAPETDSGEHFISWDGLTDLGMPADPGNYSMVVRATDSDDKLLTSEGLIRGRVAAVDMRDGGSLLETSAGIFSMDRVERVGTSL